MHNLPDLMDPPADGVSAQPTRCHARNRRGTQCGRYACKGQKVCDRHGGASPQAQRAAVERLILSEAVQTATARPLPPLESIDLDHEGRVTLAQLTRLRDALEEQAGSVVSVVTTDLMGKADVDPRVSAYLKVLQLTSDVIVKMRRAGIVENDIQIEAEKGRTLGALVLKVLADPELDLSFEQIRWAGARVRQLFIGADEAA